MDSMDKLRALSWEARRLGISYGQLAAQIEPEEEIEICKRYDKNRREAEAKRERERKERRRVRRRGEVPGRAGPVTIIQGKEKSGRGRKA